VSILKDASSTAVFGVRGANGVILVTTRQGDSAKPQLSVTGEFGLQSLAARFDRIHSWEYAELRNQAALNDGYSEENLPFTPYMMEKYKDGSDPVFFPDRDVYHDFFRDFAPQTRFNMNYSGGNDKMKYFVNAGYINQQGIIKTESPKSLGYDPSYKMNRFNFRTNIDYNIFDNLKASVNVASYMEEMNGAAVWGYSYAESINYLIASAWTIPPTWPGPVTLPGYDVPVNQPVEVNVDRTPYGILNRYGYFTKNTTQFNSSVGLEWGLDFITPGLSTKIMIAYDGYYYTELRGYRNFQIYGWSVARSAEETSRYLVLRGPDQVDESLQLGKTGGSRFYMNFQYALNYARQFGKHNVTGMFLLQRDNWEDYSGDLPYNIFGMSGRVTYNYDQRYMAEFNAGYNGSEQFHKDHRFGFFPAFSAGWVVTNESFLKDNSVLTHLKLRASYGKVGNDKLGSARFLYRTVVSEQEGYYSQLGLNRRIIQGRMGNELLSWEIAEKQNYGVDIQLFHELSLSFDLFREERNNVFISRGTVPVFQGVPIGNLPKINIGRIHNRGYETEATYNKSLNNGLAFTVKGNLAYNRNEIVFIDEPILQDDYAYRYRRTGYSIDQLWGYKIDKSNGNGYINTPEELEWAKEAYKMGIPRMGYLMYSDENTDGIIDVKDYAPIDYQNLPRISYGFSGSVGYKDFDFSFLFTGIAQSRIYLDRGFEEFEVESYFGDIHRHAWTEDRYRNGEKITFPALSMARNTNHIASDFTYADRSFFRLKNIELGYKLPTKWLQQISISQMRVYVNGSNLWTWSKLPIKTVDPEQTSYTVLPIMKMVNFGLNIVF
jgi:TonB-linked SusC/RagA family outer membrane protein